MTPRLAVLALTLLLPTTVAAQQTSSMQARISEAQSPRPLTLQIEPQGRHSLRLNPHFGAETEPMPTGSAFARGLERERNLQQRGATYGVAYLPIAPKADVFARAGYGGTDLNLAQGRTPDEGAWRIGFGARYSPNVNEGLRADYIRQDFRTSRIKANIFSFGYSRRF